ncbi:hypothetical protein [Halomicrococcus sp. NG-SE-24]
MTRQQALPDIADQRTLTDSIDETTDDRDVVAHWEETTLLA